MNRFQEAVRELGSVPLTQNLQTAFEMFARDNNLRNLYLVSATTVDIHNFLRVRYWYSTHCDMFSSPLDYLVFKLGVLKGNRFAIQHLQTTIGCVPNGMWNEFSAVALCDANLKAVIYSMEFAISGVEHELKAKDISFVPI